MLVLTRKHGESIRIGDQIKITVFFERGRIRIGIDAPKEIKVLREELLREEKEKSPLHPE